jgi:hypothetical protein
LVTLTWFHSRLSHSRCPKEIIASHAKNARLHQRTRFIASSTVKSLARVTLSRSANHSGSADPSKSARHVGPSPPCPRRAGSQPGGGTAGYDDADLIARLSASYKISSMPA